MKMQIKAHGQIFDGKTGKYLCIGYDHFNRDPQKRKDIIEKEVWLFHGDPISDHITEVVSLIPGTEKENWPPITEASNKSAVNLLGAIYANAADAIRLCDQTTDEFIKRTRLHPKKRGKSQFYKWIDKVEDKREAVKFLGNKSSAVRMLNEERSALSLAFDLERIVDDEK